VDIRSTNTFPVDLRRCLPKIIACVRICYSYIENILVFFRTHCINEEGGTRRNSQSVCSVCNIERDRAVESVARAPVRELKRGVFMMFNKACVIVTVTARFPAYVYM